MLDNKILFCTIEHGYRLGDFFVVFILEEAVETKKFKELYGEIFLIEQTDDPVEALLAACRQVCELSPEKILGIWSEYERLALLGVIGAKQILFDKNQEFETISRALILLTNAQDAHESRSLSTPEPASMPAYGRGNTCPTRFQQKIA